MSDLSVLAATVFVFFAASAWTRVIASDFGSGGEWLLAGERRE